LGTSDGGTEEGRAFHQDRLALYGRWMFLVSGVFLAFFGTIRALSGFGVEAGFLSHALGTGFAGAIWALGAGRRLPLKAMQVVDGAGTWLVCGSFALMARGFARTIGDLGMDPAPTLYVGVLAVTYTLIARAIALPSTAGRTLWVGAFAVAPMAMAAGAVVGSRPNAFQLSVTVGVDVASWLISAVAMSAVASRVIFGLRREAAQSRRMGQYTLGEKIGEGGMGVVYRAHHAMLRRPTAIKLLPPEKAGAESLERFEREVQLTASLSHPNTVIIFDYGRTVEGVFYYAMEYLDGINLDQLVRQDGPQPPGRVVRILLQVAGALAEAHGIGLVHRDVKPANIILCERGGSPDVAKVVDFGLVRPFRPDDTALTMAVTTEHTVLGTPLYMAPESVGATGEVDARSDLYALGAVAYLLLTGTPVFQGRSAVEILAHHLHTAPEPLSRRLGRPVPAEVEALVLRCLAKAPGDRPASALALRDDLLRLPALDDWSGADAAHWWLRHRQRRREAGATSPVAG